MGVLQYRFEKTGKPRVVVILRTTAREATCSPWSIPGTGGLGAGVILGEPEARGSNTLGSWAAMGAGVILHRANALAMLIGMLGPLPGGPNLV